MFTLMVSNTSFSVYRFHGFILKCTGLSKRKGAKLRELSLNLIRGHLFCTTLYNPVPYFRPQTHRRPPDVTVTTTTAGITTGANAHKTEKGEAGTGTGTRTGATTTPSITTVATITRNECALAIAHAAIEIEPNTRIAPLAPRRWKGLSQQRHLAATSFERDLFLELG